MSDFAPESGSPENQPPAGSSQDGQGSGQGQADSFAGAGDHEARIRSWQSRYDQAQTRVRELEAQLATQDQGRRQAPPAPTALTADDFRSLFREEIRRTAEMTSALSSLSQECSWVATFDPHLLDASNYGSLAEMESVVRDRNAFLEATLARQIQDRENSLLQQLESKYGRHAQTPANQQGARGGGDPTMEDLARWTSDQMDDYERQHGPGSFDQLLARLTA